MSIRKLVLDNGTFIIDATNPEKIMFKTNTKIPVFTDSIEAGDFKINNNNNNSLVSVRDMVLESGYMNITLPSNSIYTEIKEKDTSLPLKGNFTINKCKNLTILSDPNDSLQIKYCGNLDTILCSYNISVTLFCSDSNSNCKIYLLKNGSIINESIISFRLRKSSDTNIAMNGIIDIDNTDNLSINIESNMKDINIIAKEMTANLIILK